MRMLLQKTFRTRFASCEILMSNSNDCCTLVERDKPSMYLDGFQNYDLKRAKLIGQDRIDLNCSVKKNY